MASWTPCCRRRRINYQIPARIKVEAHVAADDARPAGRPLQPIDPLELHASRAARATLIAGLTVAAISLPQGMAYALLAGVDPRFGLYSAIVVTAVASIFGSSSHLINGPTSAISLVVFSALAFFDPEEGADAPRRCSCWRHGRRHPDPHRRLQARRPHPLHFRIGDPRLHERRRAAAGVGQIGNLLGVRASGTGISTSGPPLADADQGRSFKPTRRRDRAATIVLALLFRRLVRAYRLPQIDMLLALILVSFAAFLLGWTLPGLGGKTVIAIAGNVPASLPVPHIPEIKFAWVGNLSSSALAIAFLGLLEALAIAKSIAHKTRQPLDYNRQCLAEGLANLAGGFFRCLPGSGSLSRSAINFQAGAATRFSGIVAALGVALAVLLFAPLTRFIPKAALAGLLVLTAARLIDIPRLRYAFAATKFDAGLVIVTALVAVFVGVEYSILAGVLISMALFIPRASVLQSRELVVSPERVVRERIPSDPPNPDLILTDLEGELFSRRARTRARPRRRAEARDGATHALSRAARQTRAQSRHGLPRTHRSFPA